MVLAVLILGLMYFCIWDSEVALKTFKQHLFFSVQKRSSRQFTILQKPWFVGRNTTFSENVNLDPDKPVIVLTRASIRLRNYGLLEQSRISKSKFRSYDGLVLSIGVA
jgi:hypothetical protein